MISKREDYDKFLAMSATDICTRCGHTRKEHKVEDLGWRGDIPVVNHPKNGSSSGKVTLIEVLSLTSCGSAKDSICFCPAFIEKEEKYVVA